MSLRISTPASGDGDAPRRSLGGAPPVSTDYYLSRMLKLMPGEAVVAYPFLHSRAQQVIDDLNRTPTADSLPAPLAASPLQAAHDHWLLVAMAWLILAVVVLLRWQATRGPGGAQWGAVFIAAISFMLWVPVMNGSFGLMDTFQIYSQIPVAPPVEKFIPELLLVLWSILVPAFYKPSG